MNNRTEIKNWKRQTIYENYEAKINPFAFITTKIDVTNLVKFCKINKNFYAAMTYCIVKANNSIDEFRVRIEGGKTWQYDCVDPVFMEPFENGVAGWYRVAMTEVYSCFIAEYKKTKQKFVDTQANVLGANLGELWVSCEPWFQATSMIPPFDKSLPIPQFIWDKFVEENGRFTVNLMIMIHHGFADGKHIAAFIEKLNEEISKF